MCFWPGYVSLSLWSNVSKVTGLELFVSPNKKVCGSAVIQWETRSPFELSWTAINVTYVCTDGHARKIFLSFVKQMDSSIYICEVLRHWFVLILYLYIHLHCVFIIVYCKRKLGKLENWTNICKPSAQHEGEKTTFNYTSRY